MRQLVIDRSRWACRREFLDYPNGPSRLLNYQNNMCCLGFDCKLYGATDEILRNVCYPSELNLVSSFTFDEQREMARINDLEGKYTNDLSEEEREKLLIEKFAEKGVELTFVG